MKVFHRNSTSRTATQRSLAPSRPLGPRSAKQIANFHVFLLGTSDYVHNTPRHHALAAKILPQGESSDRLCELLRALEATFRPDSELEVLLVESMAVAKWRQMRVLDRSPGSADNRNRTPKVLNRYEAHCDWQYDRALARLLHLQGAGR